MLHRPVPLLYTPGSVNEKSPFRLSVVGIYIVFTAVEYAEFVRWKPPNMNMRLLCGKSGPPITPPNWFWCSVSLLAAKKLVASR